MPRTHPLSEAAPFSNARRDHVAQPPTCHEAMTTRIITPQLTRSESQTGCSVCGVRRRPRCPGLRSPSPAKASTEETRRTKWTRGKRAPAGTRVTSWPASIPSDPHLQACAPPRFMTAVAQCRRASSSTSRVRVPMAMRQQRHSCSTAAPAAPHASPSSRVLLRRGHGCRTDPLIRGPASPSESNQPCPAFASPWLI
jgi:hypothetical protein